MLKTISRFQFISNKTYKYFMLQKFKILIVSQNLWEQRVRKLAALYNWGHEPQTQVWNLEDIITCFARTSVHICVSSLQNLAVPQVFYSPVSMCGTIFVTLYSMVNWDWRVSRAGPMPFYWPSCSLPFCLLLFSLPLFFILWVGIVGLGSLDWSDANRSLPALHWQLCLIIIIIIIIFYHYYYLNKLFIIILCVSIHIGCSHCVAACRAAVICPLLLSPGGGGGNHCESGQLPSAL